MSEINAERAADRRSRARLAAALLTLAAIAVAMATYAESVTLIAELAAILALSWAAQRFPLTAFGGYLILGPVLSIPEMSPIYSFGWGTLPGGGVRLVDVVMAAMLGGVLITLASGILAGKRAKGFGVAYGLLGTYLAIEVARNLGVYGISAIGDFRFRYFVLVVAGLHPRLRARRVATTGRSIDDGGCVALRGVAGSTVPRPDQGLERGSRQPVRALLNVAWGGLCVHVAAPREALQDQPDQYRVHGAGHCGNRCTRAG